MCAPTLLSHVFPPVFYLPVYFLKREWCGVGWVGRWGGSGRKRERNHDQNMLYEKKSISIKLNKINTIITS